MDVVSRYEQIVKQAALPWARILTGAGGLIPRAGGGSYIVGEDTPGYDSRYAQLRAEIKPRVLSRLEALRDGFYSKFDPGHDLEGSMGYSLGKAISDYFLPKVYDPDDLGPYEEYSNYLKETEKGDMLLREAAKLRRRARLELLKREQEEKEKAHAAKSRYF